jgi:PAS domain S-box-containing protein
LGNGNISRDLNRGMPRADLKYVELDALAGLFADGVGSEFVRLLFERAPSAIAVFDRDMRYLAASRRWFEDYGLGDRDIIGHCHYDIFPDVPDRWKVEHQRCLAGEILSCEADEFVRDDGRSVWIRWELVPLRADGGRIAGLIMLTEVITRRVEAETAKEITEKHLQITRKIAHVGTWDWDMGNDQVTMSPEMCALIGVPADRNLILMSEFAGFVHPSDKADILTRIGRVRAGLEPRPELETRVMRKDGTVVWLRMAITASRDAAGAPRHVHGIIQDVTDQRLAQHQLAMRDRAFETAASPLTLTTLEGYYTYVNQAFVELLGAARKEDVVGLSVLDFAADRSQIRGSRDMLAKHGKWTGDARLRRADGREIDVHIYAAVVMDEDGKPFQFVVSYSDVTERKETLRALALRERELVQAQQLARLGPWRYDAATGIYSMPEETRRILGRDDDYVHYDQDRAVKWIHPDDLRVGLAEIERLYRGELDHVVIEYRRQEPKGDMAYLRIVVGAERDAFGNVTALSGLAQDVTSTRRLEEVHRETERAMAALMRNLSGMVYRCENDERWTMRYISEGSQRVLGYEPAELIDNRVLSYSDVIDPRDRQRVGDTIQASIAARQTFQLSYRVVTKTGETRWVLEQGSAIRDDDDRVIALEGYVADITAEQHVVEQLQESEARTRAIMDAVSVALITAGADGVIESFNPEAERLFGYPAAQAIGLELSLLVPGIYGAGHTDFRDNPRAVDPVPRELTGRRQWGEEFPLDLAVSALRIGERSIFIVSVRDLTERKKAEARLSQAQKMETVGQLVGGVAHDFNNLLMAMQLNLELASMLAAESEVTECIGVALNAVDRGAQLTKRLLAFSRQQPLEPKVINANELIRSMMRLLFRLLQENIETRTVLEPAVWSIEVDPAQLETALVNLIVNARDAMGEKGGGLRIETTNVVLDEAYAARHDDVSPGEHVRITVSDTGAGMPPEVLARAFDPFFTTKEVGKGSGLGLSMVYGFVKQSGGHISIVSSVGQGTSIILHFPRALAAPSAAPRRAPASETVRPGRETILLVEDDADVRLTVERLLKSLGYTVVTASDGPAALALVGAGLEPDLLLADVVLPKGLSGKDVSDAVAARVPSCRILFMSGYTEDAVMHHGRLDEGVVLLSKPFPRELLAGKIRELLDG